LTRLEEFRIFYAQLVTASARVSLDEDRFARAFASVPREVFLGAGPWRILTPVGYISTPGDDPAFIYQDVVVSLAGDGPINNGQPSLHAACLAALDPRPGETAVHVGAGTGYYTALLASLLGEQGSVSAYELDAALAVRAAANLAPFSNVKLHIRSGAEGPLPSCDLIYVNAGATRPLDVWLDALNPGGRLLFPLTPAEGVGGMLLLTRETARCFKAHFISSAMFIPCIGAREEATGKALSEVFRTKNLADVRFLYRGIQPDGTSWFSADGWWLSTGTAA